MIVAAIKAIAVSDLGFEQQQGNVRDYLLDYEAKSKAASYLAAMVDGAQVVRCWAVQVLSNEEWHGANNLMKRTYQITIRGYYAVGADGEGVNAIIDGALKIQGAIRSLNSNLSLTVDTVRSTDDLGLSVQGGSDSEDGEILVGTMRYTAEKTGADY